MRNFSSTRHQTGYSLIELSMVLVIIGLLVAGLMKGNELIVQARLRNIAGSFDGLSQAILSYQERYRVLPGDDPSAQSRWPSSASNGDGNRIICGAYHGGSGGISCSGNSQESALLWQHLRLAGLLAGSGTTPPDHPGPGAFGIQASGMGINRHLLCANGLPASTAASLDRQFDDGIANQGLVRGVSYTDSPDIPSSTPSNQNYTEEGSPLYIVCRAL